MACDIKMFVFKTTASFLRRMRDERVLIFLGYRRFTSDNLGHIGTSTMKRAFFRKLLIEDCYVDDWNGKL